MIRAFYRVTKYDSSFRDERDFYRRNDWLGYYDVGEEIEGRFYVHVGDRTYMWIGVDRECPGAVAEARRIGLFVDEGRYPVGTGERAGVEKVLGIDLDPAVDYVVNTCSVE